MLVETDEIVQVKLCIALKDSSTCEQLLGVAIDNKLNFNKHIRSTCKKAGATLNALSRVAQYMCPERKYLIVNAFLSSQLSCCSLISMFRNRFLSYKIIFNQRCFLFVYNGIFSSCEQALNKGILATEVVTVYVRGVSYALNEVFPQNLESSYSLILLNIMFCQFLTLYMKVLRNTFVTTPVNTVDCGSNSRNYFGKEI